jgi:hypothetical protein
MHNTCACTDWTVSRLTLNQRHPQRRNQAEKVGGDDHQDGTIEYIENGTPAYAEHQREEKANEEDHDKAQRRTDQKMEKNDGDAAGDMRGRCRQRASSFSPRRISASVLASSPAVLAAAVTAAVACNCG